MSVKSNIGVVTDGLVFYVDAGNGNSYPGSGGTWSDLIEGNDGTLANGPTFDSGNGGSIVFDGSNDKTDFSTNVFNGLSNTGITMGAWVYFNSATGVEFISGTWTNTIANDQVGLLLVNSTVGFAVADGSTAESSYKTNSLPTGTWVYVVGTWNTDRTYNMYVNGLFDTTGTQVGNGYNSSSTGTFRIGAQVTGRPRYFDGKISQVKVYNRALSAAEVLQNYNALKNRFI